MKHVGPPPALTTHTSDKSMQLKKLRTPALVAIILVPLLAGGFMIQDRAAQGSARLFGEVLSIISTRYVDSVGAGDLYEKAARGLLAELNDPYTELFEPKEFESFNTRTGGRYGGVGMQIEEPQPGRVTVSRVFPNTPAEAAGIREGDRIIGVDTMSARGWSMSQVSEKLQGTPGTRVVARFERPGIADAIVVNFTRAEIKIPAVPYSLMLDGIGYVPLQTFNEFSTEELRAAVEKFAREGARGAVLDLRGNPGGILDQALAVSNIFLKGGQEIASVRGRAVRADVYYADSAQTLAPDIPLVVLIDGFSASASEIVAGALQDHDRAVVVGTTSFGKGLVQMLFRLDGGYALKMTTAKWFTPSGRSIQKDRSATAGVVADVTPDSLETDSVKHSRPAFKSDAGRTVYGGGAITPDLIVASDTISTAEQEFFKAIASKNQDVYVTLSDYALELKNNVRSGFTVERAWRDELYRRLQAAGVSVERRVYDGATRSIDRLMTNRVARLAFGDSTAKRMALRDDAQLNRALDLLRRARTQKDLFEQVPAVRAGGQ
jgi:carboxyl-terminal processing protease